jgi:hypothetical protein
MRILRSYRSTKTQIKYSLLDFEPGSERDKQLAAAVPASSDFSRRISRDGFETERCVAWYSNVDFFHKDNTGVVKAHPTLLWRFIAFFGPKR